MALIPITRRGLLGAAAAWTLPASAADPDGPARIRTKAAHALFNDVTLAGKRLVAVGERGHVLLSDDQGLGWRQAAVPTRATLTAVHATDARTLWAVGHGGLILKSDDGGEHWARVAGDAGGKEVLLSIRVEPDGRGLAVGGFGYAMRTSDGGAHWDHGTLLDGEAGERHLNHIFVSAARTWLIAAEGGVVLRAEGGGASGQAWQAVKTPYAGSLWSGASIGMAGLLACGMRGHIVHSVDDGRSWAVKAVEGAGSLTAIALLAEGQCVIAGLDGTLLRGNTREGRYGLQIREDHSTLTGLAILSPSLLVASGSAGMQRIELKP